MQSPYLSQFRNVFGKPHEGVHQYRILDIALIDLAFTVLFAWLFSIYNQQDFVKVLVVILIVGIFMHKLFGVKTTVDKFIFGA